MRSLTTVPFLVRGAIVALLAVIAVGLVLSGPAGFRPGEPTAEAALLNEMKKLLASDAQADDLFGRRVAISGDTVVVGAFLEDAGGNGAGAAYVFQSDTGGAGNWGEVKKLTASDPEGGDAFGFSVAVSGDTAVVGARHGDAGFIESGAAYVFGRNHGGTDNWGEVKKITASDPAPDDFFGASIALSGDVVVVGAYQETCPAGTCGAAYVFERDEGGAANWGEVKKLRASDGEANDLFGWSVSVDGDTAVVGALFEDDGGNDAGAAYVFQRDVGGPANWGEVKKLTASDPGLFGDEFGRSVAISGNTAVVGAWNALQGGAAYVFERDEGGTDDWGQVKKVTGDSTGRFGWSVAVNGDTSVVGSPFADTEANNAGATYVFRRDQGGADNWGAVTQLLASDLETDDHFGRSVGVSGDTAVVGADNEDARGNSAGAAYVFDLLQPKPGDTDGDGCTDQQENGPDEALGGQRDYLNPWDFFDTPHPNLVPQRDGAISIGDIARVVARFGANDTGPGTFDRDSDPLSTPNKVTGDGREDYHPSYDRGGTIAGQNLWNLLPPDGAISIGDIAAAVNQFGHGCL